MMTYIYLAVGAVVLALSGAVYVQTLRVTACKAEFAEFRGGVEALGKAAEKAAKDKEAMDKILKEKADAANKSNTDTLRATVKRLRDARPGGGGLSSPTPTATSPDRTCFDPGKLAGALRSLDQGVLGIVESGSKAVIDLDTAKAWAQARP